MKNFISMGLVLLFSLGLSACSNYISMDSTYFFQEDFPRQGRVLIVAAKADQDDSLEFNHYKSLISKQLIDQGYGIIEDKDQADLVALITYGIDTGQTVSSTQPIYGYTGFYGFRSRYSMPHYTVVGVSTNLSTQYTKAIAMDLLDAQSIRDGKPKKLYQVRVKSRGECANLNQVFPAMLKGMFTSFPGESGKTDYIEVEAEDC